MKRLSISISIILGLLLYQHVHAGEVFSVSPAIVDIEGKARDIFEKKIEFINHAQRKINIYASIFNIENESGKEFFEASATADKKISLANWIHLPRSIELLPGEIKEVPLKLEINLRALPGVYHARLSFGEGSTRSVAESKEEDSIIINVNVIEEKNEAMVLKSFRPISSLFLRAPITFLYELENTGTEPLRPKGEILLYNKKGEEIGALALTEGETISPGETSRKKHVWEEGLLFGNVKAILNLSYGADKRKTIQDTVFFRVIPWQAGAFAFAGGAAVVFLRKRTKRGLRLKNMRKIKKSKTQNKKTEQGRKVIDIRHP